ncbi:MAG: ABC transporter ATP-binding protein [Lachnospiraceae bacterium]|nr:ABC transporter ATP-binding protein [Lachnospiraceae bacterium]
MYSRPVIMEILKARHTTFSIDFHFANNITLLMGDSGMGKTLAFNILRELSVTDGRILCINYLDINKKIKDEIENASGRLIIIDNADAILNDDIRKTIAFDRENQYLIIGRNPRNLLTTRENLFELNQEKTGNVTVYS